MSKLPYADRLGLRTPPGACRVVVDVRYAVRQPAVLPGVEHQLHLLDRHGRRQRERQRGRQPNRDPAVGAVLGLREWDLQPIKGDEIPHNLKFTDQRTRVSTVTALSQHFHSRS